MPVVQPLVCPLRARRLRRVFPSLHLVLLIVLTGCGTIGGGATFPTPTPLPAQPAIEKPSYTVERGDIVEELTLSGRIAAIKTNDLHFSQDGNVAEVFVKASDTVTQGQLLAELDQGERSIQLEQAQLVLDQATLALKRGQQRQQFAVQLAQLDLEEAQARLEQADTAAERELADIGVRRAEIQLAEAQAATDEELEKQVAQAQLDYTRITAQVDAARIYAPYDGQIAAVAVRPGQGVTAYMAVVTIIDPGGQDLQVENTNAQTLNRLSVQQPVTIRFTRYPEQTIDGVIERLPHAATGESEVAADDALHITFDPGDLELDIGELASITITLQNKEDVLWLPPQAIRTFQGRRFVVVDDGDRQRRVDVKIGINNPDRVEIVEGLDEGMVVRGQ